MSDHQELPQQDFQAVTRTYDRRLPAMITSVANDPERIKYRRTAAQLCSEKFLKPAEEVRLLEYGASVGNFMIDLLDIDPYYHNPDLKVDITAVDLSEPALEHYRQRVPEGRVNVTVDTRTGNIADVAGNIQKRFHNAIGLGVPQIPPADYDRVWDGILSGLEENGVLLFDFLLTEKGETYSHYRSPEGTYYGYKYSQDYIRRKIKEIEDKHGFNYDIEFVPQEITLQGKPQKLNYCFVRKQPKTAL